ncbi:MAG: cation:proton antiporter, partial [Sandaracinaceae bacterium]|nr:cation:proton antiporter [Sandaracinaceae bacterium]
MHGSSSLVVDLALVLGVAALTSPLARALGQSPVLGYLVAGLVVGPYIPIPLFADVHRVEGLAELGVVLVMFAVGLELRLGKLARVLPTAGLTGAVQIGFLTWCGVTLASALGWSSLDGLFLGASLGISSTMVVSRALGEHVETDAREHILGVLVVQDVLAVILLAAMTGVAATGTVEAEAVTADLLRLGGVLVAMVVLGLLLVPPLVRRVARLGSDEVLVVVTVGVCFVLAAIASELGYSVALGAFVSGVLVAESGLGPRVETLASSMRDVFAAIFFVSIGMTVDPVQALHTLPLALLVTVLVIVAQLVVVTLTGLVSGLGLRRSVTAGLALGQIGEFSFILAGVGIAAGAVRRELDVLLVPVAVLTAFTTPLALGAASRAVSWTDRAMPAPLRRTLGLHEQWVAR